MMRILLVLLSALLGANALTQLAAPLWWYDAVPGVPSTGAYNPHFVRDIGAAYLVAAAGLGWVAWRPVQGWPALVAGAAFLVLHAGVHVFDATCAANPLADTLRDLPGVYFPAAIAAGAAMLMRPREA